MKAYEIFQQLNPDFTTRILRYFREEHRDIYKTTVATLAGQKKLRPVYVQKKPVPAQIEWLLKTLKQRPSSTVAERLLRVWLLKTQRDLLVTFVSGLGIEHDEDGGVEDLPESIDQDKLKAAIDELLKTNSRPLVTLYLHVFQLQQPGRWPEIAEALENDDRLDLSAEDRLEAVGVSRSPRASQRLRRKQHQQTQRLK